jgi:hypothetical protein
MPSVERLERSGGHRAVSSSFSALHYGQSAGQTTAGLCSLMLLLSHARSSERFPSHPLSVTAPMERWRSMRAKGWWPTARSRVVLCRSTRRARTAPGRTAAPGRGAGSEEIRSVTTITMLLFIPMGSRYSVYVIEGGPQAATHDAANPPLDKQLERSWSNGQALNGRRWRLARYDVGRAQRAPVTSD